MDVRALLKAKRSERGTTTKTSRTTLARSKVEEDKRKGKRKLDDGSQSLQGETLSVDDNAEKRRRVEESISVETPTPGAFPADFFSDPSRAPPLSNDDDDEEETSNYQPPFQPQSQSQLHSNSNHPRPSTIDEEWEAFQRAMSSKLKPEKPPNQEAYARATIAAEPELITDLPDGFPSSVLDRQRETTSGFEAGSSQPPAPSDGAEGRTQVPEESEGDKAKREDRDERELIMDRLLEEERAQEEADAKVTALKTRLEQLKIKRAQARAAKQSAG